MLVNLGVVRGDNSSIANSINESNTLVGRSSRIGDRFSRKAVRWIQDRNGKYVARGLGTRDCAQEFAFGGTEAFSINNDGWIVGIDDDCSFVWKPREGMITVNQDWSFESLIDINIDGIAVGTRSGPLCCGPLPIAWDTKTGTRLDLFTDAGFGFAEGINAKGWIVGQDGHYWDMFECCDTQAAIWKPSDQGYTTTIIGPQHSPTVLTSEARALDINRHDEVVGSVSAATRYAFYWNETDGFLDLNKLIARNDPLRGKFKLIRAYAINDRGLIVGYGLTKEKNFHAFLLTRQ